MKRSQKGFTLLEVMIVLALVGMITGLFLEPLARVFDIKLRLRNQIDNVALSVLPQNWVRAVLSGTYMTKTKFSGDAKKVSGVTINPLSEDIGVPTNYEFTLSYDTSNDVTLLNYKGFGDEEITLAEWKGDRGAFSYFNPETQNWEQEWQTGSFVQKENLKLPQYVRLDGFLDNKEWQILSNLEPTRPYIQTESEKLQKMIEEMKARQAREKEQEETKQAKKQAQDPITTKEKQIQSNQKKKDNSFASKNDKKDNTPPLLPGRTQPPKLPLDLEDDEDEEDDDFDDEDDE